VRTLPDAAIRPGDVQRMSAGSSYEEKRFSDREKQVLVFDLP
jgi:redox-sensitive bicupin YhaK (pirin superfamily)